MDLNLPTLNPTTAEHLLHGAVLSWRQRWSVLKASGPALRDYLQGQITQDMGRLTPNRAIHSAILTPQGKAVSELYLLEAGCDEVIILTPTSCAEKSVGRLRQFALGQTLRIGIVDSLTICSLQGANAADILADFGISEPDQGWLACSRTAQGDCFALVMPENPRGYWLIGSRERLRSLMNQHPCIDESEIEAMRIIRGLPNFGVEWDESVHPLNANLIEFDGVSFDKGCYVGQEVTSRMQWRGGIKKRLYRVAIDGEPDTLPCPVRSTANIGVLRSAAIDHDNNCTGIALLPIEIAESDAALSLENGTAVEILEACHA